MLESQVSALNAALVLEGQLQTMLSEAERRKKPLCLEESYSSYDTH